MMWHLNGKVQKGGQSLTQKTEHPHFDWRRKNRKKRIRTVLQIVILVAVGWLFVSTVFDLQQYEEPNKEQWSNKDGFIALSYFGVSRSGTPQLISRDLLRQQLQTLANQGFVTVSQQDIIDFYQQGKPLPDKALFLSFEDGRNDSSLFAQPILEDLNFRATFLSYANKIGKRERKFLQPKDMLRMRKNGYWELGSNGYRLTYINIVDEEGRFLGVKDENEFPHKENALYYTHYLMDFIRDEHGIPLEVRAEMEERIDWDYEQMEKLYTEHLGSVPPVYMIMHANSLYDGMNRLVEEANDRNIRRLFRMHVNREGFAYNTNKGHLYDLTRVQAAPYWYTNHLLMKLKKDTGWEIEMITGDEQRAEDWHLLRGAAEFAGNRVILTSPPGAEGFIYLKDLTMPTDVLLTVTLAGNVIGKQTVYLHDHQGANSHIAVSVKDNRLIVEQKPPGKAVERLFAQELSEIEWGGEDKILQEDGLYAARRMAREGEDTPYPLNIRHDRELTIVLQEQRLTVMVDRETLIEDLQLDEAIHEGSLALGAEYSQFNQFDDIYDGVFTNLQVMSLEDGQPELIYSNTYRGWQSVVKRVEHWFDALIDWAIRTF
jgi:hypothetical protein